MKKGALLYRIKGAKDAAQQASWRLRAMHQNEGKVVRLYPNAAAIVEADLPTDADVIILVEPT